MSYRNPQIIVDRSAEIWAQGVAKLGQAIGQGLTSYFETRQKAKDKKAKIDEAINSSIIQGELKADAQITKASKAIKDVSLRDQFSEQAKLLANGGEDGRGAIWYNTQLQLNPPKDKQTLKIYKDKVKEYQTYMSNSGQEIGNVMAALDEVKDLSAQQIITNYTVSGEGEDELENLIAMRALQNKPLAGVDYSKNLIRNEDGTNSIKVEAYLDPNGATYKAWQKTGVIDEKGLAVGEDGKVKVSWERNLSTWGEGGSFVRRIPDDRDRNKTMQDAQILDNKGALAENFTYTNSTSHIVTDASGLGTRSVQKVVNVSALENNQTYMAEIESQAVGIEALPEKDEIDFVRNRLGWANITKDKYFSYTRDERLDFLKGQLKMQDLEKLGDFRKATKSDVDMLNIPGLKVGDDILVNTIKEYSYQAPKPTKPAKEKTIPKTTTDAISIVEDFVKDPVDFIRGRFGTETYKDIKLEDKKLILTEPDVGDKSGRVIEYDLSNTTDASRLLSDIVRSDRGKSETTQKIIDVIRDLYPEKYKESIKDESKPGVGDLVFVNGEMIPYESAVAKGFYNISSKE